MRSIITLWLVMFFNEITRTLVADDVSRTVSVQVSSFTLLLEGTHIIRKYVACVDIHWLVMEQYVYILRLKMLLKGLKW